MNQTRRRIHGEVVIKHLNMSLTPAQNYNRNSRLIRVQNALMTTSLFIPLFGEFLHDYQFSMMIINKKNFEK
jgi:hypothetical protein